MEKSLQLLYVQPTFLATWPKLSNKASIGNSVILDYVLLHFVITITLMMFH